MRETMIEKYLVRRAGMAGVGVRKVAWIGRRGCPDRVLMFPGECVWVELKAPGKKPEPHQEREHERMRQAGLTVVVVDSMDAVDKLIEDYHAQK